MRQQVNVVKDKKSVIPADFLDHIRKQVGDCFGVASIKNGEILIHRSPRNDKTPSAKLLELMSSDGFKPGNMVWAFQKLAEKAKDEDIQPFPILFNQNNKPILVAFIEGDFSPAGKKDSPYSDEYHVAEYLGAKLKKMYSKEGNDLVKLVKELGDDLYKHEMLSQAVGRGCITLFASSGDIIHFEKNDHAKDFPWGRTSNHLNFGMTEKKEGTHSLHDVVEDPFAMLSGDSSGKAGYQAFGSDKTEAKADKGETIEDVNKKTEKGYPERSVIESGSDGEYEFVEESPPSNVKGKSAVKKWYADRGFSNFNVQSGGINWQDRPKIKFRMKKAPVAGTPDTAVASIPGVKEEMEKPIKDFKDIGKSMEKHAQESDDNLKRVSTTDLKRAKVLSEEAAVLKYVDKSSNVMQDPKKLLASNSRYKAFSEATKVPREQLLQWPFEVLVRMGKETSIESLALLADEYRMIAIQLMMQKPSASGPGKIESAPAPKPEADVSDPFAALAG